MQQLRELIREVMHREELDAVRLAQQLGVTPNTAWRYLAGTVYPSEKVLMRLAQIGKLDLAELLQMRLREMQMHEQARAASAIPLPTISARTSPSRTKSGPRGAQTASPFEMKQIIDLLHNIETRLSRLERSSRSPKKRASKQ